MQICHAKAPFLLLLVLLFMQYKWGEFLCTLIQRGSKTEVEKPGLEVVIPGLLVHRLRHAGGENHGGLLHLGQQCEFRQVNKGVGHVKHPYHGRHHEHRQRRLQRAVFKGLNQVAILHHGQQMGRRSLLDTGLLLVRGSSRGPEDIVVQPFAVCNAKMSRSEMNLSCLHDVNGKRMMSTRS